jgi:hypothetical protein
MKDMVSMRNMREESEDAAAVGGLLGLDSDDLALGGKAVV